MNAAQKNSPMAALKVAGSVGLHVEEKRGQQPTGGESADRASHDTQDGGNQRLTEHQRHEA